MKVAALDLGSNTFLLLIAEVEGGEVTKVYHDESQTVRLGQGVHENRRFHKEALERADICLGKYREVINRHQTKKIIAVSTSAARDVKNKEELISIADKHGIPLSIISGDQEAKFTYLGSGAGPQKDYAVVDVGGGSTEVIGCSDKGEIAGCSIDVGSVRLTEMFIKNDPPQKEELVQLNAYIREQLERVKSKLPYPKRVIAVAGTPITLAAVKQQIKYDPEKIDNYKLSVRTIGEYVQRMGEISLKERQGLVGMEKERADVIIAGSCILKSVVEFLGIDAVTVSTKGVRYGVAVYWQDLEKQTV